jgi:hypothetical protein
MRLARRHFASMCAAALAAVAVPGTAWGGRRRRKVRRVRRRRIRRRVIWRTAGGRRLLVVPIGVAVGWELMLEDRVVVVHEVKHDVIIVKDASGKTEEIAVVKEDTDDNKVDLEGTEYEVEEEE